MRNRSPQIIKHNNLEFLKGITKYQQKSGKTSEKCGTLITYANNRKLHIYFKISHPIISHRPNSFYRLDSGYDIDNSTNDNCKDELPSNSVDELTSYKLVLTLLFF